MTTHDPATLKRLATDQRHRKLIEASPNTGTGFKTRHRCERRRDSYGRVHGHNWSPWQCEQHSGRRKAPFGLGEIFPSSVNQEMK